VITKNIYIYLTRTAAIEQIYQTRFCVANVRVAQTVNHNTHKTNSAHSIYNKIRCCQQPCIHPAVGVSLNWKLTVSPALQNYHTNCVFYAFLPWVRSLHETDGQTNEQDAYATIMRNTIDAYTMAIKLHGKERS